MTNQWNDPIGTHVPALAEFDAGMRAFMTPAGVHGGALAVVRDGRLVLARAYTFAKPGYAPVHLTSLFRIASTTKVLTSLAIHRLIDGGQLKLSDRVQDILELHKPNGGPLPNSKLAANPATAGSFHFHEVTIGHLLAHTGGWNRYKVAEPTHLRDAEVAAAFEQPLPVTKLQIARWGAAGAGGDAGHAAQRQAARPRRRCATDPDRRQHQRFLTVQTCVISIGRSPRGAQGPSRAANPAASGRAPWTATSTPRHSPPTCREIDLRDRDAITQPGAAQVARQATIRDGPPSTPYDRALPCASHPQRTVGKPCAGSRTHGLNGGPGQVSVYRSSPMLSSTAPTPDRARVRALEVHASALRVVALKLCRGNQADAADLVQDTLERALRREAQLAEVHNLHAWLATILHRLFLDRCRAAQRRPHTAIEEATLAEPEPPPPPVWADIGVDDLHRAVAYLEPPFRAVFELHSRENASYADISARLGIPKNTVGTRLARARQKLRELLTGTRTEEPR